MESSHALATSSSVFDTEQSIAMNGFVFCVVIFFDGADDLACTHPNHIRIHIIFLAKYLTLAMKLVSSSDQGSSLVGTD